MRVLLRDARDPFIKTFGEHFEGEKSHFREFSVAAFRHICYRKWNLNPSSSACQVREARIMTCDPDNLPSGVIVSPLNDWINPIPHLGLGTTGTSTGHISIKCRESSKLVSIIIRG
ncbi:hypothetical protein RRG08_041401 [Elysia crispata]|uniref:Uncharacterized protein n=1 Tax=Elysia crispata TaxID=231223 RepID=A0AAE0XRP5_9GAST|nr:hypothetical protein RRG08_041401 [Elysia crispata]